MQGEWIAYVNQTQSSGLSRASAMRTMRGSNFASTPPNFPARPLRHGYPSFWRKYPRWVAEEATCAFFCNIHFNYLYPTESQPMKAIQIALLLLIPCFAWAQKPAPVCKCPKTPWVTPGTKPTRIFHFSNGRSIGLIGYEETKLIRGKTLYSEFVLSEWGAKKIIKFWGAVLTCDVTFANDTVYVKTLYDFPVGRAMKPEYLPWTIERIYFSMLRHSKHSGGKAVRNLTINLIRPKYERETFKP